jgi:hypothetical protein
MKRRSIKYNTLTLIAGVTGILLQSYLFMCGCSTPANSVNPPESAAKSLYSSKCTSCHSLLPPQDYTVDTWRLKKMTQMEKQTVLDYLELYAADR